MTFTLMIDNKAILEWLISAASDAKSASVLYRERCYAQALFSLQQAVEKANKAVGLWAQFLQPNDLKKAGHHHDRIHDKAIEQQEKSVDEMNEMKIDFIGLFSQHIIGERVNFVEYQNEIRNLKQIRTTGDFATVQDMNIEQLENHLAELESVPVYIAGEMQRVNLDCDHSPFAEAVLTSLRPFLEENEIDNESEEEGEEEKGRADFTQLINDQMSNFLRPFFKVYPYFLQLHFLGFFTSEFAFTRYPDMATGFNPATDFNMDTPIVRLFPRFHKIASENIRRLALLARIAQPFSI